MPRAEEFDAFYAQTRSRLLLQTYAFSGDLGTAAAALRDAFTRSWQRWRTLRTGDPEAWVRREAGRLATLRRNAHPRHRLDETGADSELLDALQSLPPAQRRRVLLQTLADLEPGAAAQEVAMTEAAAREATETGLAMLTAAPPDGPAAGCDRAIAGLDARLARLSRISERVAMPRPGTVRSQGTRRQRRGTVAAVVAAATVVLGAGVVVTLPTSAPPQAADGRQADVPDRPEPPGASADQLLGPAQLSGLDDAASWRVGSDSDPKLYSPCQSAPSADPRARATYVRTFRADSGARQRAVQAVEVSRTPAAARRAYRSMARWYSGCQDARVQLLSAHAVGRRDGAVQILSLRDWRQRPRTVTVALARSGVVTTGIVHEVDRLEGPGARAVARSMSTALDLVCTTSGGACGSDARPHPTPLPPTGEGAGFLGVVDLPPFGRADTPAGAGIGTRTGTRIETVWSGTEPTRTSDNPAATLCDRADFTGPVFDGARSRSFVMPESDLPQRFGLSETVGLANTIRSAKEFVNAAVARVQDCSDRELSAQVGDGVTIGAGGVEGHAWQLTFEVSDGAEVGYRLGLVRVGTRVAEVSFSGTAEADVAPDAFADLLLRAGERLRELDTGSQQSP